MGHSAHPLTNFGVHVRTAETSHDEFLVGVNPRISHDVLGVKELAKVDFVHRQSWRSGGQVANDLVSVVCPAFELEPIG